jgi:hypothetical protein
MGSEIFRDPYADMALSQLIDLSAAVKLSPAERSVLIASVRSEILVNKEIHRLLKARVDSVLKEISANRPHLPILE